MTNPDPKPAFSRGRLIARTEEERVEIVRIGHRRVRGGDLYVRLLDASWRRLLVVIAVLYIALNLIFATLYWFLPGGLDNARPGSFLDAFFFSVQTLATIGYGKMAPVGVLPNLLVTVEALTGFAFYAVVTGLVFAKFSRPTARVLFSDKAVIAPYNGVPHLMLRLANERGNRIVDAKVNLVLLRRETSKEGHLMNRFYDLNLVRNAVPLLQLTWTVMHPITMASPLFGVTPETLEAQDVEVVVSLSGIDETLSQTIHARYSYVASEIFCGFKYQDVLRRDDKGRLEVNYARFHAVEPIDEVAA